MEQTRYSNLPVIRKSTAPVNKYQLEMAKKEQKNWDILLQKYKTGICKDIYKDLTNYTKEKQALK